MFANDEVTFFIQQGREEEFHQLQLHLIRILGGEPQVVFVTGDAGVGKTLIVEEFCQRAQESNAELVIAWGECSTQRGLGDSYLPFREILALLTGDIEDRVVTQALTKENTRRLEKLIGHTGEALVELGPDLVGTLVPGAGLVLRMSTFLAKKVGWLDPLERLVKEPPSREKLNAEQLFEQFTRVLMRLAEHAPLILVLDDLHWADTGTLELLFYLTRRMHEAEALPLFIIGTYRLAEVKLGRGGSRHPLEPIVNEITRYWGGVEIDLTQTIGGSDGQAFVNALLDSEPNRFDDNFRESLFLHTEGHPLFTVVLLRVLQERGVIKTDALGQWFLARPLALEELPDKIDAVIGERIGRLEPDLKDILSCASIEGELFTAEVTALVRGEKEIRVAKRLDEDLERRHRLVMANGVATTNGQRLHLYRFRHSLFCQYLYGELGSLRREKLHAAVGAALENLYQEHKERVVNQLARHFDLAAEDDKAIVYYHQAADNAREVFANEEAIRLYSRALELLNRKYNQILHFELLAGRRQIYGRLGKRDEERIDLNKLLTLTQELGDREKLALTHNWRASYYESLGEYETATTEAEKALSAARSTEDLRLVSQCFARIASIARWKSDYHTALQAAREALEIARRIDNREAEAESLMHLGLCNYDLGDYEEASEFLKQALPVWQALQDRRGEANCRYLLSYVLYGQGDFASARSHAEQALNISRRMSDKHSEVESLNSLAFYHIDLGDYSAAIIHYKEALNIQKTIEDRRGQAVSLLNIGLARSELGQFETAKTYLEQALQIGHSIGGQKTQSYALTYLGLVFEGLKKPHRASEVYAEALRLRRDLGQDGMAMDCMAGIARCALVRGNLAGALSCVEEALAWIDKHGLGGIEYPLRVYLTCIRVLDACGKHERAQSLLHEAYNLLMERADRIDDPKMRGSFLKDVSFNNEILEMWHRTRNDDVVQE